MIAASAIKNRVSRGTENSNKDLWIKGGLILASGGFLVYLLKVTGVIQSKADKKAEAAKKKNIMQNSTSPNSPFSPNYYKNKPGAALITKATAQQYADQIYDSVGWFKDDESSIYAVFRRLKAKTQVSWLAEIFYMEFGEDLYNFLADNLDDDELATINTIVNGMSDK